MRWKHDKARYFGVKGQDHKLTYLTYWNTAKGRQFLGIFAAKELNSLAEILRASGVCTLYVASADRVPWKTKRKLFSLFVHARQQA